MLPLLSSIPILSWVSDNLGSVGVREVGISLHLFSALLAGLLLQHTLHASVYFVSCNRSDPSVLVAWKSHSRTEILASTHLEKKSSFWRTMELILPPSLLCSYYTKTETSITAVRFFSWNNQVTFIGLTSTCLLTTPTKSHPHKFLIIEIFSLWWHQHSQNSQK